MGISYVDFTALKIGNKIRIYDYTLEGVVETRYMYPLLYQNSLIALAINIENDDTPQYQITTSLVKNIKENVNNSEDFALIYDNEGCYLFDGESIVKLVDSTIYVEGRSNLLFDFKTIDFSNIILEEIGNGNYLGYEATPIARTQTYYSCNVSYVTQLPYQNLCWAASTAMVINCLTNSNYVTTDIVVQYYGSIIDQGLPDGDEIYILLDHGITYTHNLDPIADNVIFTNIRNGYPMCASFISGYSMHMSVIYAVNITAGYFYVIDPLCGMCTANSNTQQYYNSYANTTLTLDHATCKYR